MPGVVLQSIVVMYGACEYLSWVCVRIPGKVPTYVEHKGKGTAIRYENTKIQFCVLLSRTRVYAVLLGKIRTLYVVRMYVYDLCLGKPYTRIRLTAYTYIPFRICGVRIHI